MEGVRLHLVADENGIWNLPESQEESRGPPEIPEILIDSLTASGTVLIVEDARTDAPVYFRSRAWHVAAGFCLEVRELWSSAGELLAVNPQTFALIK